MQSPATSVAQRTSSRSLGVILVDSGKLSLDDANRVLQLQKEKTIRFGDAALELGLLSQADLNRALARQYDYPYLIKGESEVSEKLIAAYEPQSQQVEALRALRSQLMLRWFAAERKRTTLAVVSADKGEGRSYLAANLAIVFSQLGERTLLVDADMRNPTLHKLFNLENRLGLSSLLSERGGLDAVSRIKGFVDLSVLVAGPTPPNPQELLGRPTFAKFIQYISAAYDVVIFDTPPASICADVQIIAASAKGVLLVARKNHSSVTSLSKLVDEMAQTGAESVGVAISDY